MEIIRGLHLIVMKLPAIIVLFLTSHSFAQKSLPIDSVTGTWKGSSKCQIKNSPCHDEINVYHITRNMKGDSCTVQASKMVKGVEEDMGTLHFGYDPKKSTLHSSEYGEWDFKISGNKMDGTLYVRGNLYRIIHLDKTD